MVLMVFSFSPNIYCNLTQVTFVLGGRLSKPCVKVEDSSRLEIKDKGNRHSLKVSDYYSCIDLKKHICSLLRHYRPIYFTLPNMPQINLRTPPPYSPFLVDDKDPPGNKRRGHRCAASLWLCLI